VSRPADLVTSKLRRPLIQPGTLRRYALIELDTEAGATLPLAGQTGHGKTA
jgi:hypothetical protein